MKAFVVLTLVAVLGGCGKKEAIIEAERMADAICACKDRDCALKARIDGTAKLMKFKDAKGSEEEFRTVQAAISRSQICQDKLMTTGADTGAAPTPSPAPNAAGEGK